MNSSTNTLIFLAALKSIIGDSSFAPLLNQMAQNSGLSLEEVSQQIDTISPQEIKNFIDSGAMNVMQKVPYNTLITFATSQQVNKGDLSLYNTELQDVANRYGVSVEALSMAINCVPQKDITFMINTDSLHTSPGDVGAYQTTETVARGVGDAFTGLMIELVKGLK